uniref:Uncharacterized protein n=1 Tax=Triticum urartu TaxID=4572 RepID=A0A8R7TG75_TRIUA
MHFLRSVVTWKQRSTMSEPSFSAACTHSSHDTNASLQPPAFMYRQNPHSPSSSASAGSVSTTASTAAASGGASSRLPPALDDSSTTMWGSTAGSTSDATDAIAKFLARDLVDLVGKRSVLGVSGRRALVFVEEEAEFVTVTVPPP